MPCCQVCVFFFTAFLLVAERTARESYLGHIHLHACMQNIYTHMHTHITEHYASVAVLVDCDHLPVRNAPFFFFYFIVCARARLCVLFWPQRVDVQREDYSGCGGMSG